MEAQDARGPVARGGQMPVFMELKIWVRSSQPTQAGVLGSRQGSLLNCRSDGFFPFPYGKSHNGD